MKSFIFYCALFFSQALLAGNCKRPSSPLILGHLEHQIVNESSGLIISRKFEDRLYHINDSGDGPFFYISKEDGSETSKVELKNFIPEDVEDLAYGKCLEKDYCLYIADVGDNAEQRKKVQIAIVKEKKQFGKLVTPVKVIEAEYPDRPHNLEGVAVHPNGDLYVVTKEVDYVNQRAAVAHVFVLRKEQIWNKKKGLLNFEYVGPLDLPYHLYLYNLFGRIVTAFDISPDGKRLLIMTYSAAIELEMDLATEALPNMRDIKPEEDFSLIPLMELPQAEAIAYYPDGQSFLYSTEYHEGGAPAPLVKVNCQE